MVKDQSGIRILNAALETSKAGDNVVLRGTLDTDSLKLLKVDDYQREVLSTSGVGGRGPSSIRAGIDGGKRLPDIELGMRGENFSARGHTVTLNDPVYIIDGLQRVSAFLSYLDEHDGVPNGAMPLGATINLCTTKEWEKERFADLNQKRTAVSPGVLLRNMRDKHPSILTLYGLSRSDASFALYQRVSWDQRMKQQEIIKALLFMRTAATLHKAVQDRVMLQHGPLKRGQATGNKGAGQLDRVCQEVGLQNFRENVKDFFEMIDECWSIRNIEYGEAQGHLRGNFLTTIGTFIANNDQLWNESKKRIKLDTKVMQRFASFPINDPEIRRLCGAGTNTAVPILYRYLLDHMNKRRPKGKFQ